MGEKSVCPVSGAQPAAVTWESEYRSIVSCASEVLKHLASTQASLGNACAFKMGYRKSTEEKSGEFVFAKFDAPLPSDALDTGWLLETNVPYSSYFRWIYERGMSYPVLCPKK